MSNFLLTIIRENVPEVRGPSRVVLMALADRSNDSGKCWPSQATIAKDAGVCLSSVKIALRKLRSAGLIKWTNTTTDAGDAGNNIYHVILEGRAGDAPPRAGDDQRRTAPAPQVGQDTPEGRAGDGYKASMEAPREASLALDVASSSPPPKKSKARGTLEELKAFAVEIGLPESDGEAMFYHWEMNGWMNGVNPSKNWQAGMRKWKSQGWHPSQKINGKSGSTPPPPGTVIIQGRAFKS